jgi:hypothetical protein
MLDQFISRLQEREPLPPLFPTQAWDAALSQEIQSAPDLSPNERAGLLLWNDDLEASHNISQGINTPTGSFWHAIMHRREGDISNAIYWWRRTGLHPAFHAIYPIAISALREIEEQSALAEEFINHLEDDETWDAEMFTTYCADWPKGTEAPLLCRLQVIEIETLLRWCHKQGE